MPVETAVVVPLGFLSELRTHEEQFFPWVSEHPSVEHPEIRELLPFVTGHFFDERAFAVNDFVVTEYEHEVLVERVHDGERDFVLVIPAVRRVPTHVGQRVVHPPHVPFEAKPEAARVGGTRNGRPSGTLFRNRHHVGEPFEHNLVETFEEIDGVEIFPATMPVWHPLTGFPRVIEVQHGGDRIDAKSVDMKLFNPVQSVRDQKVAHLISAVVEDERSPVHVLALAGVGVLVEMGSVKTGETVGVFWEVSGYPVEDDSDAVSMRGVDEVPEVVWVAEPTGRSEKPGNLVAPRSLERVFGDGEQFDVGKAEFGDVRNEPLRELTVGEVRAVGVSLP